MNSSSTWKPTPKPFDDSKGKSVIEFDDRRSKGLCFLCGENYVKGHKCKKKESFVIEVTELNDVEGDQEGFVEEIEENKEDEGNPQISVYAIDGVAAKSYQTMKVIVTVNKKPLHILIDSGSTHNFLDVRVAKKLDCKVEEMGPV